MLQVLARDQHQVIVADDLHRVAHDAAHALGILREVQFKLAVAVDGVSEFLLPPVGNVKAIAFRQRRDFADDVAVHTALH